LTTEREDYPSFPGISLETSGLASQASTEVIAQSIPVSVTVHGKWELIARP
jgi:hypothetical protein